MFVCLIRGLIYPWLAFYSLCSQDLLILLSLSPKFWDYRHASPNLFYLVLGIESRACCMARQALYQSNYISSLALWFIF